MIETYDNTYENKVKQLLSERFGKGVKAFVRTYGCQQNVSDSERIKTLAINMGYELCDGPEDASLVVFNTCAVRHSAEEKVFGNLGALLKYKRLNPDMIIVMCGCMTAQEHTVADIKKRFPFVDIVLGTSGAHILPSLIYKVLTEHIRCYNGSSTNDSLVEGIAQTRKEKFRAFVPAMYGCNNFCSYCIVPYVRGRERSRRAVDVINDIEILINDGCRDITLLGQNVNSYRDPESTIGFPELLRKASALDGDFKLRFMTSHPKDATKELFDTIAECDKLSKHIHLPVQSGSNRILKQMNRKYTREDYIKLTEYAKNRISGLSLTSDIIVGFPGETREDFEDTLRLVKEVGFDSLFTFLYSKRVGTPATQMENQVDAEEKQERFDRLVELQTDNGLLINKKLEGSVRRVLVDEIKSETQNGLYLLSSRDDCNKIVEFEGKKELLGNWANVNITKAQSWLLKGELSQK